MDSSGELDGSRFSQDGDLDFAGVGQLALNGTGDFAAELGRLRVVKLLTVDEHSDFATCLNRIGVLDAWEPQGE